MYIWQRRSKNNGTQQGGCSNTRIHETFNCQIVQLFPLVFEIVCLVTLKNDLKESDQSGDAYHDVQAVQRNNGRFKQHPITKSMS